MRVDWYRIRHYYFDAVRLQIGGELVATLGAYDVVLVYVAVSIIQPWRSLYPHKIPETLVINTSQEPPTVDPIWDAGEFCIQDGGLKIVQSTCESKEHVMRFALATVVPQ